MKDWQNLIAVMWLSGLSALLTLNKSIPGEGWVSMNTALGIALILGIPFTIAATGWTVQAKAKAAETMQAIKQQEKA